MVLALAKASLLLRDAGTIQAGMATLATGLHAFQQLLSLAFTLLIVTLFLRRRSVIGRRSSWPARIVAVVGTFALYAPAAYQVGDDQPLLLVASSALILIGLIVSIVSLNTLDQCFGMFPEARGLVTVGPYHYIRHPLYLGEIITGLGLVIGTAWLPLVGLFIVFVVCQYLRAGLEERALAEVFPEYEEYRRQTWRIIPFVY
jgi:protein-S-isoprenylcysteine O-methyltransferase Ste14